MPNLSFSVSMFYRFMQKLHESHWKAAREFSNIYKGRYITMFSILEGLQFHFLDIDSYWEGDDSDRRYTTGYIGFLVLLVKPSIEKLRKQLKK